MDTWKGCPAGVQRLGCTGRNPVMERAEASGRSSCREVWRSCWFRGLWPHGPHLQGSVSAARLAWFPPRSVPRVRRLTSVLSPRAWCRAGARPLCAAAGACAGGGWDWDHVRVGSIRGNRPAVRKASLGSQPLNLGRPCPSGGAPVAEWSSHGCPSLCRCPRAQPPSATLSAACWPAVSATPRGPRAAHTPCLPASARWPLLSAGPRHRDTLDPHGPPCRD